MRAGLKNYHCIYLYSFSLMTERPGVVAAYLKTDSQALAIGVMLFSACEWNA